MQNYKVEILQEAVDAIEKYVDFIALDSVENALNWYKQVSEKIKNLSSFPERCSIAEESRFFEFDIRQLIIGSYRVLFRITGNTVQILYIKHSSQERKNY